MATRQRSHGEVTAVPRQYSRLVYEDFQPRYDWKEEAAENIIIIHLPGFTKERLKVAYVSCSRTVKAQGERPVVNDRWSRFNQSFPVPDNSDTVKIRAKFQHGVLSITIPKKIVARVEDSKTTQKIPSFQKSLSQSKSDQKVQDQEIIPPPLMAASTSGVEKRRREEIIAQPDRSLKRVATERKVEKGKEDHISPKPTSSNNAIDERKWVVKTNQSRGGSEKDVDRQKSNGKKDSDRNGKAKETEESEKYVEKKMVTNGKENGEKSMRDSFVKPEISTAPNISENRDQDQEKKVRSSWGKVEDQEMISKEADLKAEKEINVMRIKTVMDSGKQRVNGVAKRMMNNGEKRQSLVNIGAAVLVILALGVGAYLSYIYRSRSGISSSELEN